MSRRSSRKVDISITNVNPPEATITPQKGRKSVKVETPEKKAKIEVDSDDEPLLTPKKSSSALKINRVKGKVALEKETASKPIKQPGKRRAKIEDDDVEREEKKPVKKRKTKEDKEGEAMPLAARTAISTLGKAMYIGAHVSGAGGVQNSIQNALHIGGNSFALFLKSQRKWSSPALAEEARDQFKAFCTEHSYDMHKHVLPHGSYLVNLAQPDPEKANQAYACFLDDLRRCEELEIGLYNFHPGNTGSHPRPEAIARIASQLNKAHKATKTVVTVLENMAGSGNTIGSTWEDLRDIITLVHDKSRVGVCIDTCHAFAAGYDLRSPEAFKKTMSEFDSVIGMSFLRALHLNDSKAPFNSRRDLHHNIGMGFLGLRAFHNVVNFEAFRNLPMVLETPIEKKGDNGKAIEDKGIWAAEIKLLEGLIGLDPEDEYFKTEEQRLSDLGAEERSKHQTQADKKAQKTIDSMFKKSSPKKQTRKAKKDEDDSDISDGGCNH